MNPRYAKEILANLERTWSKTLGFFGPRVFAILGSLLILVSTFLVGVPSFQKELELRKIETQIRDVDRKLEQSRSAYDRSLTEFNLSVVQRSVPRYSMFQDPEIQAHWDSVYAASLHVALLDAATAAEDNFSDEFDAQLRSLEDKAKSGDTAALATLHSTIAYFIMKAGQVQDQEIRRKAELELRASSTSNAVVNYRIFAICLQILGLFLLLLKELPLSVRERIARRIRSSNAARVEKPD